MEIDFIVLLVPSVYGFALISGKKGQGVIVINSFSEILGGRDLMKKMNTLRDSSDGRVTFTPTILLSLLLSVAAFGR